MSAATIIKGEALALVSKYTDFDPRNPHKTPAHDFVFIDTKYMENGALDSHWTENYVLVGTATLVVSLHDTNQITEARVAQLRAERLRILAEAQAKATQIEREIQSLLAITNEVAA